jgi:hypothetical protein
MLSKLTHFFKKHNTFPFQSILIGWMVAFYGYYLAVNANEFLWFARFGSLTVLFGVIAEFALLQKQFTELYTGLTGQGLAECGSHGITDLSPAKWHSFQSICAHLTVVTGTIIWGFGDWFLLKIT